jgi:hypothetical protein
MQSPGCHGNILPLQATRTPAEHYAKRRTGWRENVRQVTRPRPEDVQKVKSSHKATRDMNMIALKRQQAEREAVAERPKADEPADVAELSEVLNHPNNDELPETID